MAHQVESMIYQGAVPWHGLGTPITGAESFDEAFRLAGLDWEVELFPLFTEAGEKVSHKCVRRSSDNSILGVVGPQWRPLQNRDAFGLFQPLVESGELSLHTAGSLQEGRRVWVLMKINSPAVEISPGDAVEKYALLSNSHDGTLAVRMGFTPIRVVCANTLAAAHNSEGSRLIRVRHSKSVLANCEAQRDAMNSATGEFEMTVEQFRFLASRGVSPGDLRRYVKLVLNVSPEADEATLSAKMRNIIDRICDGYVSGVGQDVPGARGTWWGAYNAVTWNANHVAGRSPSGRLNSLWFGNNARTIKSALGYALEMACDSPAA